MKMRVLLDQHQKFSAAGLPGNMGDGYLMTHNSVFRRIRDEALKCGYVFSNERDHAYESFPLLQLDEILLKKTLPYSNNVYVFEKLSPAALDAITWEDIDGNLKRNFIFHEGCHAVVRTLADKIFVPLPAGVSELERQQQRALGMLLEESCANACELLGMIDASDAIHKNFYEMNSYICEFQMRTQFKNAVEELGFPLVMRFMVLSYLNANFLRERIEEADFQAMLKISSEGPLDSKYIKTLRALSKVAFHLSERFRQQTTAFHLRLAGIKTPTKDLFNFNFLKAFTPKAPQTQLLTTFSKLSDAPKVPGSFFCP